MNKIHSTLFVVILSFFIMQTVHAEPGKGYFLVGVGQASVEEDDFEGDDTSFKIGGGYQISENGAFEVYYINYGEATDTVNIGFDVDVTAEATAIVFQGVGMFPASPTVDVIGKIGLAMWDSEVSAQGFGSVDDDGTDLIFGFGAAFKVGGGSAIRVEYELTDFDDADVTVFGVSYTHSF